MSVSEWGVLGWIAVVLYTLAAAFLIIYGLHMYLLTWLCRRRWALRQQSQQTRRAWYTADRPEENWPVVTTQIPLYNEANVARRVPESGSCHQCSKKWFQHNDYSSSECPVP